MAETGFSRRYLDDRAVGIAEIDGVKVLPIVRPRDVHAEIRKPPLPFQKAVSGRNVEGKMMVRSGSPPPLRIADPRTCHTDGRGFRIDDSVLRHHVKYRIPLDVTYRVSSLRFGVERLKSEGDDRKARIEVVDGPFDQR